MKGRCAFVGYMGAYPACRLPNDPQLGQGAPWLRLLIS